MTSAPIVPTAILGGSVLLEREPFDRTYWLRSYRGIEVLDPPDIGARTTSPPAHRPVLVYGCVGWSDGVNPAGFESVVSALSSRTGVAQPRIMQTFGRMGRTRVVTLEPLAGIGLDRAVGALKQRGQHLSASLALAITFELLPFLRALSPREDIFAGSHDVMVSPDGTIRVRPIPTREYHECYRDATNDPVFEAGPAGKVAAYIAPFIEHPAPIRSERWNVFVVGMLLYELLIVEPWPEDMPVFVLLRTLLRERLPSLRSQRPELPESVASFIERAMDYRSEDRSSSWEEVHEGLSALRSRLDPVDRSDLVALYESLPTELRLTFASPPDEDLQHWRELPHLGYEPLSTHASGSRNPG